MKKRSGFGFVHSAAAVAIAFGAIGQAQAVGYCNTNSASNAGTLVEVGATAGLAVSDVTFNGANSENCYGVVIGSNDNVEDVNAIAAFGQSNWADLAKVGNGATNSGSPFNVGGTNFTFTLKTNDGSDPDSGDQEWGAGGWTLSVTPVDKLSIYMDFVVSLKASDRYALYLFDDVKVSASNAGTWDINFNNNGGNVPNLSHLSLYGRVGTQPPGSDTPVPEPTSIALTALALGGLGLVRRRRRFAS